MSKIEILNGEIEALDDKKSSAQQQLVAKTKQFEELEGASKTKLEKMRVRKDLLSKELERHNTNRTNLYQSISNEEKSLQDKEEEMSKLANLKQIRQHELE